MRFARAIAAVAPQTAWAPPPPRPWSTSPAGERDCPLLTALTAVTDHYLGRTSSRALSSTTTTRNSSEIPTICPSSRPWPASHPMPLECWTETSTPARARSSSSPPTSSSARCATSASTPRTCAAPYTRCTGRRHRRRRYRTVSSGCRGSPAKSLIRIGGPANK